MALEDMPEEIQEAVRANKATYERMVDMERVKILNQCNLIPVGNTNPYDVYNAARYTLDYLYGLEYKTSKNDVIKALEDALKLEHKVTEKEITDDPPAPPEPICGDCSKLVHSQCECIGSGRWSFWRAFRRLFTD